MKSLGLVFLVLMGFTSGFAAGPDKSAGRGPGLPKVGVNLARDDGGWINFVVVDHGFVLSFFDEQKIPVAADVQHGLVRYAYAAKAKDRTVLTLGKDGMTLSSPNNVRGPMVFRVHLALFNQGPEDLAETYAFSYSDG